MREYQTSTKIILRSSTKFSRLQTTLPLSITSILSTGIPPNGSSRRAQFSVEHIEISQRNDNNEASSIIGSLTFNLCKLGVPKEAVE
jgi:hypothetical protein